MGKYRVGYGVAAVLCFALIGYFTMDLVDVELESTTGLLYLYLIFVFAVMACGLVYLSSVKRKVGCSGAAGVFFFQPNAVVRFQKDGKEIVADEEVLVWGNLSRFEAGASSTPEQPKENEDSKLGAAFLPC